MNALIGKTMTVKIHITENYILSISNEMNTTPEQVTVEMFRESCSKACEEGEFISLDIE